MSLFHVGFKYVFSTSNAETIPLGPNNSTQPHTHEGYQTRLLVKVDKINLRKKNSTVQNIPNHHFS